MNNRLILPRGAAAELERRKQNQIKQDAIQKLLKERQIKVEQLTQDQLAKALQAAIECGDFTRLVTVNGQGEAQAITYAPYRLAEVLRDKIVKLRAILKEHNLDDPTIEKLGGEN